MSAAGAVIAVIVGVGFVALAVPDLRTMEVPVRRAQLVTTIAIVGLGAVALVERAWGEVLQAVLGAALVTIIQLVPYRLQQRRGERWLGRADVRLGVPFGWTLGWFGVGFVYVGFGAALLLGLIVSLAGRRRRIAFVPFLTVGFWVALLWALASSGS